MPTAAGGLQAAPSRRRRDPARPPASGFQRARLVVPWQQREKKRQEVEAEEEEEEEEREICERRLRLQEWNKIMTEDSQMAQVCGVPPSLFSLFFFFPGFFYCCLLYFHDSEPVNHFFFFLSFSLAVFPCLPRVRSQAASHVSLKLRRLFCRALNERLWQTDVLTSKKENEKERRK